MEEKDFGNKDGGFYSDYYGDMFLHSLRISRQHVLPFCISSSALVPLGPPIAGPKKTFRIALEFFRAPQQCCVLLLQIRTSAGAEQGSMQFDLAGSAVAFM